MNRLPKLSLLRTHAAAITYHFRVEERDLGWALVTVNDATGELTVMSDWGNWQYMWSTNPKHMGAPTLHDFIAKRCRTDCHYLADKLTSRGQRERFDPEATVAELRRRLCERRLAKGRRYQEYKFAEEDEWRTGGYPLTKDAARSIWDQMDSLMDVQDSTLFVERFMQIDGYTYCSEEPWEHTCHKPDYSYEVLLKAILPAVVDACAKTCTEREATAITEQDNQEVTAS